jgi:hypothetical protein
MADLQEYVRTIMRTQDADFETKLNILLQALGIPETAEGKRRYRTAVAEFVLLANKVRYEGVTSICEDDRYFLEVRDIPSNEVFEILERALL